LEGSVVEVDLLYARVREILQGRAENGEVRFADIIDAASDEQRSDKVRKKVSGRLDRLKRYVLADVARQRGDRYPIEDGVNLAVAARLKLTPARAAAEVTAYMARQQGDAGTRILEALVELGIDSFERQVISRLFGTIVSRLMGPMGLSPGSAVFLHRFEDPASLDGLATPPKGRACAEWLTQHWGTTDRAGVVTDTKEISPRQFALRELPSTQNYSCRFFPPESPAYVLISASTAPLPRDIMDDAPDTAEDERVLERLLNAITIGFTNLKSRLRESVPQELDRLDSNLEYLSSSSVRLWILAHFACDMTRWSAPRPHCVVLRPQTDPDTGSTALVEIASTKTLPWSKPERGRYHMHERHLLSPYAALTNMSLVVPRTEPPRHRYVSRLHDEEEWVGDNILTCISVPAPADTGGVSRALYLYMPARDGEDLRTTVKSLQVLACVLGGVIQRDRETAFSIAASHHAMVAKYLTRDEFEREVRQKVKQVAALPRQGGKERRLALVLVQPAGVSRSETIGRDASNWLSEQFEFMVPQLFLAGWAKRPSHVDIASVPFGEIAAASNSTGQTAGILIPTLLTKEELDWLRSALPTRLNNVEDALTEGGDPVARLNVWVVDEKWIDQPQSASPVNVQNTVNRLLARAANAAKTLPYVVGSHQAEYVERNWHRALAIANEGLDIDPSNPYLRRRAAEFSICQGAFLQAQQHAEIAIEHDKQSVIGHCLLADAFLGQGLAQRAMNAYEDASKVDPVHPLPHYFRGNALLAIARLLRQSIHDLGRPTPSHSYPDEGDRSTVPTGVGPTLTAESILDRIRVTEVLTGQLAEGAANAFRRARPGLDSFGTPGVYELRNFQAAPAAFGLGQTETLKGTPEAAVQRLRAARERYPRDEHLYHELLWAQMWDAGHGEWLFNQLSEPSAMERLLQAAVD
jgi:tetratricopeptide (TPR) repeat protein